MSAIIKTGICSFGLSGKVFHAPFIHAHPGFELTGIVERHNNDSKAKYPQAKVFRSVEELCADKNIELVIVNTPGYLHFEHAKAALLAGKNILVEKPFTISVKEAEELIELAEKQKLQITIYQNRRYDGDYRAVKNIIEKKLLGELRFVEVNYNRFRPKYGGKPHKEGDLPGAGNLYDLSPHMVDQVLQLFGWPMAIFADIWKMRDDVIAPDYFNLIFYYEKLRVHLSATSISREPTWGYILHGMKGSLFDDLYKFLTGQGKNPVLPEDGLKTVKIIEAAFQSANAGKIISL